MPLKVDAVLRTPYKMLRDIRRTLRMKAFGNNHDVVLNARYHFFEQRCRRQWLPGSTGPDIVEKAQDFHAEGYVVIEPGVPPEKAREIGSKVDDLFAGGDGVLEISSGLYRLIDGLERVPELTQFVAGKVERVLEEYFQSYFKIYNVSLYRTVPDPTEPESSFLWHVDNVPRQELKLMVYLDDVSEDTGAFRLKLASVSDDLRRKGIWDRKRLSALRHVFDDAATTATIEGKAGTCILFQNGRVLHKATAPKKLHRDVATMVIIPSVIPWREHFARNRHLLSTNAGVCLDPNTDRPENIGYKY